jgi:hypothetical protein
LTLTQKTTTSRPRPFRCRRFNDGTQHGGEFQ